MKLILSIFYFYFFSPVCLRLYGLIGYFLFFVIVVVDFREERGSYHIGRCLGLEGYPKAFFCSAFSLAREKTKKSYGVHCRIAKGAGWRRGDKERKHHARRYPLLDRVLCTMYYYHLSLLQDFCGLIANQMNK
jgi:hypothetical protein